MLVFEPITHRAMTSFAKKERYVRLDLLSCPTSCHLVCPNLPYWFSTKIRVYPEAICQGLFSGGRDTVNGCAIFSRFLVDLFLGDQTETTSFSEIYRASTEKAHQHMALIHREDGDTGYLNPVDIPDAMVPASHLVQEFSFNFHDEEPSFGDFFLATSELKMGGVLLYCPNQHVAILKGSETYHCLDFLLSDNDGRLERLECNDMESLHVILMHRFFLTDSWIRAPTYQKEDSPFAVARLAERKYLSPAKLSGTGSPDDDAVSVEVRSLVKTIEVRIRDVLDEARSI